MLFLGDIMGLLKFLENKLKTIISLDVNAIAWFDAYLTNRMQVTDVGGIFVDPRAVPYGVP